ncbi:endolytic transglycosylase MltG [Agromyces mariniharenae]|uniref:Endolytic murein transglycosylase n=1 Tax=Agromyces mariniharenae TaxID=2604423 RepID=A0A5S4V9K3_9MICO|nr:endolytic transglycosylase MltG [Agromyces mariniharenae]TYL50775.1 endolytic transglycosylase MltG [Agromyces mariniharenae]
MTHLPPEPRGSAPGDATDWHALLAGETPDVAGGGAATGPTPASRAGRAGGQPMTRREAREAERRALEEPEPEVYEPRKPSRAERRAAAAPDYHDHDPEHARTRRRGPWGCLVGLLVVAALAVGAFFFLQGPINAVIERFTPAADYTGSGTGEVMFVIHAGDTGSDVAENLVDAGVTASYDAFYDLLLEQPTDPEFHPGAYALAEEMSAQAALDALMDPANKLENTLLITEGTWARDALAEASAVLQIPIEDLQAAAANPQALGLPAGATSVEGFLFPATYTFNPGVTAQEVVQTMVANGIAAYDAAGVAPDDRLRVATIASLIQREGLPQDFTKVSRVIQNRLDQGMLLQFDSTVHYGTGDNSVVTTTDAERADASNPYNTYVHQGLPPGPIGNPGAEAIQAALTPADGPWLYFVTVNPETGETVFTTTIEEHEAAAEQFYQWLEDHPDYGQ